MRLIFIHGRAQQRKDPLVLKQQWEETLNKGLKKAGLKLPPETNILFPFYGDKLDELIKELNAPLIEDVILRGAKSDSAEVSFRSEFLQEIATGAGISDEKIQAHYKGKPLEKGPQNWEWVQAILAVLDKTFLGEVSLDLFTRDVYVYLTNKTVRKAIDQIVAATLSEGACVVVGHSLGSVIGYNVLRKTPETVRVKKYITVGSPLGLRSIKNNLESPLVMPHCVSGWFNAMDERDVVPLHPLDSDNFNISPSIENKTDVTNHTSNHHGIAGYLDDPVVARRIVEALSS